jgi:hypothetical protein
MVKCSKCGSTAQLKIVDEDYYKSGQHIERVVTYKCGCGHLFITSQYFIAEDNEEVIDDNV